MTDDQGYSRLLGAMVKLHHLEFKPDPSPDGELTRYRATIVQPFGAGQSEFALTVVLARPVDSRSEARLNAFLDQIRAGFLLVASDLGTGKSDARLSGPTDVSEGLTIIPELVKPWVDGKFGVVYVVTSEIVRRDDLPSGLWTRLRRPTTWNVPPTWIFQGAPLTFTADPDQQGRVHCLRGRILIDPVHRKRRAGYGINVEGSSITISSVWKESRFSITGLFFPG